MHSFCIFSFSGLIDYLRFVIFSFSFNTITVFYNGYLLNIDIVFCVLYHSDCVLTALFTSGISGACVKRKLLFRIRRNTVIFNVVRKLKQGSACCYLELLLFLSVLNQLQKHVAFTCRKS